MPTLRPPENPARISFHEHVSAYNADVLDHLGIDPAGVPDDAVGVEIELDYTNMVRADEAEINGDRPMALRSVVGRSRRACNDNGVRAVAKWDSSIGPGFELATEPISGKEVSKIASAYGRLLTLGARPTCYCGLHVHINRKAFASGRAIVNFGWLWSRPDPVLILSGRALNRLQAFANPRLAPTPWNVPLCDEDMRHFYHQEHHGSVCYRTRNTVELRVMAAPRSLAITHQRLELVVSTVDFTNVAGRRASWEQYVAWLESQSEQYPNATTYMARRAERLSQTAGFSDTPPDLGDATSGSWREWMTYFHPSEQRRRAEEERRLMFFEPSADSLARHGPRFSGQSRGARQRVLVEHANWRAILLTEPRTCAGPDGSVFLNNPLCLCNICLETAATELGGPGCATLCRCRSCRREAGHVTGSTNIDSSGHHNADYRPQPSMRPSDCPRYIGGVDCFCTICERLALGKRRVCICSACQARYGHTREGGTWAVVSPEAAQQIDLRVLQHIIDNGSSPNLRIENAGARPTLEWQTFTDQVYTAISGTSAVVAGRAPGETIFVTNLEETPATVPVDDPVFDDDLEDYDD